MKTTLAALVLALLAGCVKTPPTSDFNWREHDYERRQYWSRDCDHHDHHDGGYNSHDGNGNHHQERD